MNPTHSKMTTLEDFCNNLTHCFNQYTNATSRWDSTITNNKMLNNFGIDQKMHSEFKDHIKIFARLIKRSQLCRPSSFPSIHTGSIDTHDTCIDPCRDWSRFYMPHTNNCQLQPPKLSRQIAGGKSISDSVNNKIEYHSLTNSTFQTTMDDYYKKKKKKIKS